VGDRVDPAAVPQRTLSTGAVMPGIGLGTFGSDHVPHGVVANAVDAAIEIGYRHVDCASVYGNEALIGEVLNTHIGRTVERNQLWISSKVWNDCHRNVATACERSLRDLGVDALDMYLVHWPFPNFHPPQCSVDERNPDAVPYRHEDFMETWSQMEALVDRGLVRHIGTSNTTRAKLDLLLGDATIRPSVNQMELHPHLQQPEFRAYLRDNGIEAIGFCPIGSPDRPERDRTPADTSPIEDRVLQEIAASHGIHPATLCVKWAVQSGHTPIPFSTNPRNMSANLQAATSAPLSDEEMAAISSADRNCRMIKGQVFLWKEGQTWHDLWDENGTIAT
jgi:diketogulonate reductase-like aldo/keto reductase